MDAIIVIVAYCLTYRIVVVRRRLYYYIKLLSPHLVLRAAVPRNMTFLVIIVVLHSSYSFLTFALTARAPLGSVQFYSVWVARVRVTAGPTGVPVPPRVIEVALFYGPFVKHIIDTYGFPNEYL